MNMRTYSNWLVFMILRFIKNIYQFFAVYLIALFACITYQFLKLTNLRYVGSSDDTVF